MSPLKRKKLDKIRIKLDKLDNSLIRIIKKRTNLVKKVLALKEKKKSNCWSKKNRYDFKKYKKKVFKKQNRSKNY